MMFNRNIAIKYCIFVMGTCLFLSVLGCGWWYPKQGMRAYIDDNRLWKIVESCGYEHCYPMVDLLTSDIMTIRLELTKEDYIVNFFVIQMTFIKTSKSCEFNPSQIGVKLKNGDILKPKVFPCRYTRWTIDYLRSNSPLREPIVVEKEGCYLLFFDYPNIATEEELIMDIKKSVIMNGETINLPIIHFRKGK